MPKGNCRPSRARNSCFERASGSNQETHIAKRGDSWLDYADMSKIFATIGIAGLAANNGLTEAENFELFACRDVSRILELILTGLTRS